MKDWQERVLADHREARRRRGFSGGVFRRDLHPLQFACSRDYIAYIAQAALKRGVNRSTYVRRALAVAAAADLGIDVKEILWESPKPRGPQEHIERPTVDGGARDLGHGIEDWCTHPGCDGAHLSP